MEEIIEWVKTIHIDSNPLFKANIFNYSNAEKIKTMKRPLFQKFIESITPYMTPEEGTYVDYCDCSLVHFGRMGEYIKDNDDYIKKKEYDDLFRKKYNPGMLTQEPFGLKGKTIGEFDMYLKKSIPNFDGWVMATEPDKIIEKIHEILKTI